MKIAIWHNLPSGGGKRAMYDHIVGLVARGHTIEVWCPQTADRKYLPLDGIVPEHVVPLKGPDAEPEAFAGRLVKPSEHLTAMDDHCRRCAEEINRGGFDLLIAHPCRFRAVSPIGKHVNLPKIVYVQEPKRYLYEAMPTNKWMSVPPPDPGSKWWNYPRYAWRRLYNARLTEMDREYIREEYENAKAFDTILVNSHFSRESVLRAYGLDCHVCYLGVNTALFQTSTAPRGRYAICVGSLTPMKNPEFLIRALSLVPEAHRPELQWVTNFDESEYARSLQALAKECGVRLNIRVNITDDELVPLIANARMMLYAPRLEPFGYAPLEANACGTPIVTVAEGGMRETVIHEHNGLVTEAEPEQMAAAVTRMMTEDDLADRLGMNGRRNTETTWALSSAIDRMEYWIGRTIHADR